MLRGENILAARPFTRGRRRYCRHCLFAGGGLRPAPRAASLPAKRCEGYIPAARLGCVRQDRQPLVNALLKQP
eukprot:2731858-Pleurochrysis_carterae.AAC.3